MFSVMPATASAVERQSRVRPPPRRQHVGPREVDGRADRPYARASEATTAPAHRTPSTTTIGRPRSTAGQPPPARRSAPVHAYRPRLRPELETDDGRARQVRLEGQEGRTAEQEARPRGAMRRSRLIERRGDTPAGGCDRFEIRWEDDQRNRDLGRRRLDGGVVQPHHSPFIASDFGAIVIVRLEVPMGDGVRMVGIGFVDVLRRDNGQEHHARREHAGNRGAPERVPHRGRL